MATHALTRTRRSAVAPVTGLMLAPKQTERARPDQIKNRAGGYVFQSDDFKRLARFLIIGTEAGTYYANETELTTENIKHVLGLIQSGTSNGRQVVNTTVKFSKENRAPKNDFAIFVLALAASYGDSITRSLALRSLSEVCRTGTHLFQFAEFVTNHRGWGRALRRAVADWYLKRSPKSLELQLTKYKQRNGWSHRDLLRLSHPRAHFGNGQQGQSIDSALDDLAAVNMLFSYAVGKDVERNADALYKLGYKLPKVMQSLADATHMSLEDGIEAITEYKLQREHLPTEWLREPEVWDALISNMGLTAIIRNLGNMAKNGILTERSSATLKIVELLSNQNELLKQRVHPMALFVASKVFASGRSVKGSGTWTPVQRILTALDDAFYLSYGAVQPNGLRNLVALDVSRSMCQQGVMGVPNLKAREATAAMAMVQANTEPHVDILGFSSPDRPVVDANAIKGQRLDNVLRNVNAIPSGGTDLSLPIIYALKNKFAYDVFTIYTDNETHEGGMPGYRGQYGQYLALNEFAVHPYRAMQEYRKRVNPNAKLIVVGVTATDATIADPLDPNSLDVVGFDAALPNVINQFALL